MRAQHQQRMRWCIVYELTDSYDLTKVFKATKCNKVHHQMTHKQFMVVKPAMNGRSNQPKIQGQYKAKDRQNQC